MISNQLRTLVIDNVSNDRKHLITLLSNIRNVNVVGEADNAETALYKIVEHYPNLVFIDDSLPGKSGMELVELLAQRNVDVPVVLVSKDQGCTVAAIRNQVYDFLLKPVKKQELEAVVEKYRRLNKNSLPGKLMEVLSTIKEESKIRINSRHSYILINPSEIVYCEAEDGGASIHLSNGKEEFTGISLTQLEALVASGDFYRLGRSVLINLSYVRSVNKSTDSVLLKFESEFREVYASHQSIKAMLESCYNYA